MVRSFNVLQLLLHIRGASLSRNRLLLCKQIKRVVKKWLQNLSAHLNRFHVDAFLMLLVVALGAIILRLYVGGPMYKGRCRIDGKTVIITGANTGIGKIAAKDLAKRGGRIILACRDLEKANIARQEIISETKNFEIVAMKLDLASFESIRTFCQQINQNEPRVDILINNAGVMMCNRALTEDGLEMQMGVNHFGHFLLTNLLLDKLKLSAPSRVIIVSSAGHILGKINFDDLNSEKSYSRYAAYFQSKLANILHMRELARRLEGTNVTVNSIHPGIIDTDLWQHFNTVFSPIGNFLAVMILKIFGKTPVQGAQTTIYAAVEPALNSVTNKYFSDCREVAPHERTFDGAAARRLWDISEKITRDGIVQS